MAEAIQFDLLEEHKENIQQLPSGRSAKALARVLSPRGCGNDITLDETKLLNDALRQEYENELLAIDDSDDPLDIYVRYVRWTLKTYPSAQSTPQSQLVPLLERATNAFLNVSEMKDDPRYLKLWLQYVQFVSSTPRETYAFLARHCIGEKLALFYEEFAGWLEGAGRRQQADEIYRMGIDREARPTERLNRKYREFQARCEAQPVDSNEPASPAVPVRAALAAKFDPFSTAPTEEAPSQQQRAASATSKPKKPKMAIFSDADAQAPPLPSTLSSSGWNSISSTKERKKENTIEAQPWAGQTLKAGKKVGSTTKMEVFKDPSKFKKTHTLRQDVNPSTGRRERAFVDMNAIYGENSEEYSFEELRALHRGWTGMNWKRNVVSVFKSNANAKTSTKQYKSKEPEDLENLTNTFSQKLNVTEPSSSQENTRESKPNKQKQIKVREVRQETQTIKLRDSPTKSRPRKRVQAEPTMTLHSKSAQNDIYNMYNTAAKQERDDTQSGVETDLDDDTFSTAGESTCTGKMSTTNSEYGDETIPSFGGEDSPWSDFTTGKISKVLKKARSVKHKQPDSEDLTGAIPSQDQTFDAGFDTQAIAALANQDFGELDTMAIAKIAGTGTAEDPLEVGDDEGCSREDPVLIDQDEEPSQDLQTPIDGVLPVLVHKPQNIEMAERPRYVPLPPEDYEPSPMWSYRDPSFAGPNKLPYMTPIVEQTESSLAANTLYQNRFTATKTPSRVKSQEKADSPSKLNVIDLLLDSPQPSGNAKRKNNDEDDEQSPSPKKLVALSPVTLDQKVLFPAKPAQPDSAAPKNSAPKLDIFKDVAPPVKPLKPLKPVEQIKRPIHKGPIIQDLQCNPCDDAIIEQILKTVHPAPSTYSGFHDHSSESFGQFNQIKAYARKISKNNKSSPREAQNGVSQAISPLLRFEGGSHVYAIKKELGEGAFAPVFLIESVDNEKYADEQSLIKALKAENEPKTLAWEFHILHLLKSRLGHSARTMESIILADECHLYRDECFLVLKYHSQGTVLDLVNLCRSESARAGKTAEGLEESVAMYLSVELLRTVEDMHRVGILHGDLKADNCLMRLNPDVELTNPYNRLGRDGWSEKGMTIIDFGRGIDTRAFRPEARFIADWAAGETDCPEIREAKPWKWEIDLFGTAGVIHSILFGRYIETVSVSGGGLGQKKEWKLREGLKRYWEKNIWNEVFTVLINGSGKKEDEVRKDLQRIRGLMEDWLEQESERNGRDLRTSIRKCERLVCGGTKAKR